LDAVGKRVNVNDLDGEIIGVIGDFHVRSLHSEIKPTVFFNFWPANHNEAQIRMDMKDVHLTLDYIERLWNEYYPEYVFEYEFLDDFLKGLYASESKMLTMIRMVSLLAILIGCLGLFGLVSFMVLQRTKEIGVRKVLGATVMSIFFMISRDFLKWVVVANLFAWPIAYYFMNRWLQNFAYRVNLSVWIFILSGLAALVIALLTVSYQTIKAATANPSESLKYE
jgi:putative ABC transport system permease protein